ncbi:ATP-binding cassette domain-containing protein [Apibacter muscae]|uniref:ABC transporter ATP-binding protein n=1 Tax=Apibacter muscae TaxID=2509004 RepID=UPI0011AC0A51|nr:ATP-binding cassette domain-containing protein [Apibacter muscae]TWP22585.1 ATP-binding cassette domain-containing protein [Apibacter muscae]TWP27582.1 ATP-binding cassette domain-containing protein [Apibacter muscae]
MSVKIQNLKKRYKDQWALEDINLDIKKGEIVGLLGPNGAGKTTMMRAITGSLSIDGGKIWIQGLDNQEEAFKIKSLIGYLPENNPLYTDMYVKEYLTFVANIHRIDPKEIEGVIEKVGLSPEKGKKISQLSKGYKQRVGLAQAIIFNPEILILDEPTNGLDPNQIIEIRQLIQELGKEKTVILSTHIMQEVEALCSRVILLNHGKIIQDKSIEEFQSKFTNLEEAFFEYTR